MCVEFSDPDEDGYALDGWRFDVGLMYSSGAKVITEASKFEANLDDPRLERANILMYNLNKNDCIYPWYNRGWTIRDSTEGAENPEGVALLAVCERFKALDPTVISIDKKRPKETYLV